MLKAEVVFRLAKPAIAVVYTTSSNEVSVVEFQISTTTRAKMSEGQQEVFSLLNAYWASLPELQQLKIFGCYKMFHDAANSGITKDNLTAVFTDYATKLMSLHSLEQLKYFVSIKSGISFPPDLSTNFILNIDNNNTRDKTYTLPDYIDLVVFLLAIKAMVPVWNEFIALMRHYIGDKYVAMTAFALLKKTPHFTCEAVDKLHKYISANAGKIEEQNVFSLGSMSTEDYISYLLSMLCVTKLCNNPLMYKLPEDHLLKICYPFIKRIVAPRTTPPNDVIRDKPTGGGDGSDQGKGSVAEGYLISTVLSVGALAQIQYSVGDHAALVRKLAPGLDMEFVNDCVYHAKQLLGNRILDGQNMLMSYVLAPVIRPEGLIHLPYATRVEMLGIAQAVLFYRGHKYLSVLLASRPITAGNSFVVAESTSRIGLRAENVQKLIELYPIKTDNWRKGKDDKQRYRIFQTVDLFVDYIGSYNWTTVSSPEICEECLGKGIRTVPVVGDIRNLFAEFIIEIGSRNWRR